MERIRRLSALLMALALVLPQSSCVNNGQVEVHYPLSGADSAASVALIAALYLLPLLLLFVRRFKVSALIAGVAVVGAGLYFIAYGATIAATSLLVGWYTYTAGAVVHLVASLVALRHALSPGVPRVDRSDGRQG